MARLTRLRKLGLELSIRLPSAAPETISPTVEGVRVVSGGPDAGSLVAAGRKVARELALDAALAEVIAELDDHGIPSLLLKGPAIARWLYDDPADRPYTDIDLLVPPDQHAAARRCLTELGFELHCAGTRPHEKDAGHHECWTRGDGHQTVLELHHALDLVTAEPQAIWRALGRATDTIEVAGHCVRVPALPARALIVALHAAQHGPRSTSTLRDLDRALDRTDTATWSQACALARELGSLPAFAAGLRLTRRGQELAKKLGISDEPTPRSVRIRARTVPDTVLGIERLVATHGVTRRLRLLAEELAPSPTFIRALHPVARRGWLGLLAAYIVVRPIWLARKLPSGVVAWLRAAFAPESERPRSN